MVVIHFFYRILPKLLVLISRETSYTYIVLVAISQEYITLLQIDRGCRKEFRLKVGIAGDRENSHTFAAKPPADSYLPFGALMGSGLIKPRKNCGHTLNAELPRI